MKELLAFLTKAKISAGFIVLAIVFCFGGCSNPTNSGTTVTDPNHIGNHGGIEVRIALDVDRVHGEEALARLRLSTVEAVRLANVGGAVRIIEITGPASGAIPNLISAENGVVRGTLNESDGGILGFVSAGAAQMSMLFNTDNSLVYFASSSMGEKNNQCVNYQTDIRNITIREDTVLHNMMI